MLLRRIKVALLFATALAVSLQGQMINLDAVIGASGDNAAAVDGPANQINFTGYAQNTGLTTLTASGSSGSSAFDFAAGFSDTLDRATGSTAGAGNVFADQKYDSSSPGGVGSLVFDTNGNGSFLDESSQSGFGMHGDTFITFDLDAIRAAHGLAPATPFTLTGSAGVANFSGYTQSSAAIILDSAQLAVFDWTESGPINQFSTYTLTLSGSARYLTFVGLSGLDSSNWGAHIGFGNVQLQAVPEPSAFCLLGAGLAALALRRSRRPGKANCAAR